jgi:hypothetical protein
MDLDRRALLAVGVGEGGGWGRCGWRAGGSELDWETGLSGGGLTETESPTLVTNGRLVVVGNRSGRTHDFDTGEWVDAEEVQVRTYRGDGTVHWSAEIEGQYDGSPAADERGVYVPLDDGELVAVGPNDDADTHEDDGDGAERWRSDGEGLTEFVAGDGVVVGTDRERIVGFDAEDGDRWFGRELGDAAVGDVVIGNGIVWIGSAHGDGEGELVAVDNDGEERFSRSLPSTVQRMAATAEGCLLELGDDAGLTMIGTGSDDRWDREAAPSGRWATTGDRLYGVVGGDLTAIDLGDGAVRWERPDVDTNGRVVADDRGVYFRGTAPRLDECGLVGLHPDGERWWEAPLPPDVNCSGELTLVGDRLVLLQDSTAYGFHAGPGRRFSLV